ncbi:hypothetical protein MHK_001797 [Candidatus Magnetomorum sp. HK-1]|nr:hypothetical protein MHK_001797 [Candidatus Magnetomorum sp. HK-1]
MNKPSILDKNISWDMEGIELGIQIMWEMKLII